MKNKDAIKHQTLFVSGMHCSSCELLIERQLKGKKHIVSATASLKDSRVDIGYKGSNGIDIADINREFRDQGYVFSTKKTRETTIPFISFKNGRIAINTRKTRELLTTVAVVAVVISIFVMIDRLQLAKYITPENDSSLGVFVLLGLVASISSCAALVGGLLLSMTKQWNDISIHGTETQQFIPHTMFHVGRLLAFTFLGGVLGIIGKTFSFNTTASAILVVMVSIVMILLSLQMLNVTWAQKIRLGLPKSLTRYITAGNDFSHTYMPFLLGVCTFFIPCGFTLIAQGIALTSGNFIRGALVMLSFALGTLPVLLGISISGSKLNRTPNYSSLFSKVAGILILFFALYNLNLQANVLGIPSFSDLSASRQEDPAAPEEDADGEEQILKITTEGFDYIATGSTTLRAGIKTTLIINNTGARGCATTMVGRGLFDGYLSLKPGENIVTFIPRKGVYKITCSMGMVTPVIITVK